ncbi:MAG: nucleotidyltransferase domain-containing protein [Acidobacteria bacterium]|nr:nucleotidyltransferase domain-containing protein [Acidobacteriota bacterium]
MRRLYRADAAERDRVRRALVEALRSEPDVGWAWLHGSFLGDGGFHDVDVGVHLAAAEDAHVERALDLGLRLDRATRFPVDVQVLNGAPASFLFHVFRDGHLLLCRDDTGLANRMERTVREYLDVAPLRRRAVIEAFGA